MPDLPDFSGKALLRHIAAQGRAAREATRSAPRVPVEIRPAKRPGQKRPERSDG